MWTTENRARYDRSRLRYPSDLTDEEWAYFKPLIPTSEAIEGLRCNLDFLRRIVQNTAFRSGAVSTSFIDDQRADLLRA